MLLKAKLYQMAIRQNNRINRSKRSKGQISVFFYSLFLSYLHYSLIQIDQGEW